MRQLKSYRYVLFLTEQCNKKCFYCDIGQFEEPVHTNKELIEKYFPLIAQREDIIENFTITGGEPGLVDEDVYDFIFDNACSGINIRVNTNGEFIKRGYFEKYYDKISYIGLHPSINLETDIDQDLYCDEKITIFQPIHARNIDNALDFCKRHDKLTFNLIPFYHKRIFDEGESYMISQERFKQFFNELTEANYPNIEQSTLCTINRLSTFSDKVIKMNQMACGNSHLHPTFNFAKGELLRCPTSYSFTDKVPMNTENITKLNNFELFKNAEEDINCNRCIDCLRYFEYYLNNMMYEGLNKK